MAAAEARATCHCSVKEHSRRAPNLPGCPSSSSKLECDGRSDDAVTRKDFPFRGCGADNKNRPNSDSLPYTKWWLHRQTNIEHLKDVSPQQLNTLEAEVEVLSAGLVSQTLKVCEESLLVDRYFAQTITGSCLDQPWNALPTFVKYGPNISRNELMDASGYLQKSSMHKVTGEFCPCADEYLMDLNSYDCIFAEQSKKLSSKLDSHWVGVEKSEPWWRSLDKDELASLVSYKSLEHIENCDLPQPQAKHFDGAPAACAPGYVKDSVVASLDQLAGKDVSNMVDSTQGTPGSMGRTQCTPGAEGLSQQCSKRLFSNDEGLTSTKEDNAEAELIANSDLSKAQLLEALCHSQTRAREAEKAAQAAYEEKEHIINLFFRQASHLFAYKQWLQVLQLETLCLHLRNSNQPTYATFPSFLTWVPGKGRHATKCRGSSEKRKPPPRCKMSKSAVAFALGLSLAGAGLILGWTMGWLFPAL